MSLSFDHRIEAPDTDETDIEKDIRMEAEIIEKAGKRCSVFVDARDGSYTVMGDQEEIVLDLAKLLDEMLATHPAEGKARVAIARIYKKTFFDK